MRDLRISVDDVLGWLADGQTVDQIVADGPEPTPATSAPAWPTWQRVNRMKSG